MRQLLIAFSVYLITLSVGAIEASLDSLQINQDETVTLTVRLSGEQQKQEPDLSVLEKDFEILNRSQRSQLQIINGEKTAHMDWIISLAPKRTGQLSIPPIRAGKQQSQPLILKVRTAKEQQAAGESPDLFLSLETDKPSVYVQAQLNLTLRLHYKTRLQSGQLSDPSPKNAQVVRLGEDKQTVAELNGERYQVLERQYAIFPETSGELVIPALLFEGQVQNNEKRQRNRLNDFGFFGFSDNLKTVRVRSKSLQITVKPQPAAFKGKYWLPAKNLKLFSQWQPQNPVFKVGEPITRNLTLQAQGLRSEQLPALSLEPIDGLSFYPDKAQQHNQLQKNTLIGLRGEKIALRPAQAGTYTLPEMIIPWWDTQTDTQRYTKLPAETIEVQVAELSPEAAADPAPVLSTPKTLPAAPKLSDVALVQTDTSNTWFIISLLCALGWLVTALLWWRQSHKQSHRLLMPVTEKPQQNLYLSRQAIKQACQTQDAQMLAQQLLLWGKTFCDKPPNNLQQLAQCLNHKEFEQQIQNLQQYLYAADDANWSGQVFWQTFKPLSKASPKTQTPTLKTETLATLYPST